MFNSVKLYQSSQLSTLLFHPEKTYLLMLAQGCDTHLISSAPDSTQIYSITTPAIIWQTTLYHDALLCCELSSGSQIVFCQKEKDASPDLLLNSHTIMMFVHWLDQKIYNYLDKLFSLTHEEVTIMGVGCGRTDGVDAPIITHNTHALNNGFLVLFSNLPSSVGSAHSSDFHSGYFIAKTEKSNHIMTINGESAFGFYQKMIQKNFNEEVTRENIFEIGLKYPFGLGGINGEQALRVPASVDGDALVVAGPMDEESTLCLMKSTPEALSHAPLKASSDARLNVETLSTKECFVVECAGRHALLGKDFEQELEAIAYSMKGVSNMYGLLSLGEIANNADKYIEYFNESCVIGVLHANQ